MTDTVLEFYIGTEVVRTEPNPTLGQFEKRKALGVRCAELYIEAQGLCQKTSDAMCDLAESKKGDLMFKRGFNERMSKSPFAGRIVD